MVTTSHTIIVAQKQPRQLRSSDLLNGEGTYFVFFSPFTRDYAAR